MLIKIAEARSRIAAVGEKNAFKFNRKTRMSYASQTLYLSAAADTHTKYLRLRFSTRGTFFLRCSTHFRKCDAWNIATSVNGCATVARSSWMAKACLGNSTNYTMDMPYSQHKRIWARCCVVYLHQLRQQKQILYSKWWSENVIRLRGEAFAHEPFNDTKTQAISSICESKYFRSFLHLSSSLPVSICVCVCIRALWRSRMTS